MPTATPEAAGRAAAPKQGVDFSGTNVQEEGVDEPDIVKTDGNTLFAVANGKLRAVDVGGCEAAAARLARARAVVEPRAAPARRPAARPLARRLLDRAAARDGRADRRPTSRRSRCSPRWTCPTRPGCGSSARSRSTAPTSRRGSSARSPGSSSPRRCPSALPFKQPTDGSPEAIAAAERQNEAVLARSKVASWLPSYRIKRAGAKPGRARPLVQCRHVRRPTAFSGPRHAHRPHRRPDEGPAAGRLGRGDDRRPDRLRVAGEPLRRDRALGRPARSGEADAGAGRRPDRDPQVRHLEPDEDAVPRQRQGLGLPAQPVVALRVPAASSASSAPRARPGGARAARPSRS